MESKPSTDGTSIEAILAHYEYDPSQVERIAASKVNYPLEIVEPNPQWPVEFQNVKSQIETALSGTNQLLGIEHIGSTSVPGLAAKDFLDIDVTVRNIQDEASYIPALEAAGFHFLTREPRWHEHRLLCAYSPRAATLHVWGPGSPEAARHVVFRDWLRENEGDRRRYEAAKRESAEAARGAGEGSAGYNRRKEGVVREILERAFRARGYTKE